MLTARTLLVSVTFQKGSRSVHVAEYSGKVESSLGVSSALASLASAAEASDSRGAGHIVHFLPTRLALRPCSCMADQVVSAANLLEFRSQRKRKKAGRTQ